MKMRNAALVLASVSSLLLASPQAQAQQAVADTSYQNIGLDCGGWFVGFATTNVSGRIYGYGDVFGVWRSDNSGETWKPLHLGFSTFQHFIVGVGVKTDNADVVGFTNVYTGFFGSNDGGASWNKVIPVANGDRVYGSTQLINNPVSGKSNEWILARKRTTTDYTTGQLWRSKNGLSNTEAHWEKLGGTAFDGTVKPRTVYMHPNWPGQIWVGTEDGTNRGGGLWVSVDDGANFTQVWGGDSATDTNQQGPGGEKPVVNSIVRRPDGTGFIGSNVGGILISSTNNWGTPSKTAYTGFISVSRENGAPITSVAVLPSGAFVSGQDPSRGSDPTRASVIRVTDDTPSVADGKNSTSLLPKLDLLTPVPVWATPPTAESRNLPDWRSMITIDPTNSSRWYTTGGQSPFISTDSGATWKYPPNGNGLAGVNTYGVSFIKGATTAANAKKVFISGADHGIFTLTDGGASGLADSSLKKFTPSKHTTFKNVMSVDGQTIVGAGSWQSPRSAAIVRSTDGGITWEIIPTPKPGDTVAADALPINGSGVTRSVMSLTDHNDFIVMQGSEYDPKTPGIWRTTDGGTKWTKATGLPSTFNGGKAVDFYHSWLEHGGPDFPVYRYAFSEGNGFYRSTDGGSSWSQTGITQPGITSATAFCVDQALGKGGTIWIAKDSTLKKSTDRGATWQPVSGFTSAMRVSVYDGRIAIWGKKTGDGAFRLYYSPNNGDTWTAHTGSTNESTANSLHYGNANNVFVDPYRVGKVWLSGLTSAHVIDAAPAADPVFTSSGTASGTVGTAFTYTAVATSTPAATMTYTSTALPAGLALNASSGVISGTPTTATTGFNVDITATGAYRTSAPKRVVITIAASGALVNYATGGTVASNSVNSPTAEKDIYAFDGSQSTKWLTRAATGWISYTFAASAGSKTVTKYVIRSANDYPDRDPRNWTLEGSNNGGSNWSVVATESGKTFASRFLRQEYTVATPGAYTSYRLNVTLNNGSTGLLQLSELELIGN